MTAFRLPGPLCAILGSYGIDAGTLCRATMAPSVPIKPRSHSASPRRRKSAAKTTSQRKSTLTAENFAAAAQLLHPDMPIALVHAFADVESGGRSGMGPEGLPVIAYEGHVFRKLTKKVYDQDHPLLSYKYVRKAGPEWRQNNKNQSAAWATLRAAMELDRKAALQSCSWGMFQVMGFNYKSCGFSTVDAFVDSMKAGEGGQLLAFVGYCKKKHGMVDAMLDEDFATMATLYNGEDYGDYDKRIEKAYHRHGGA